MLKLFIKGGFNIPPYKPFCPYQDKECPKINEMQTEIETLKKSLSEIQRYVYILIGMVAINWGFTLW